MSYWKTATSIPNLAYLQQKVDFQSSLKPKYDILLYVVIIILWNILVLISIGNRPKGLILEEGSSALKSYEYVSLFSYNTYFKKSVVIGTYILHNSKIM